MGVPWWKCSKTPRGLGGLVPSKVGIDPQDVVIRLELGGSLGDVEDPMESRIRRWTGTLLWEDESGSEVEVGWFSLLDFDVEIVEPGEPDMQDPAFDVMDNESRDTYDVYRSVKEHLDSVGEGWVDRVVYIDRIRVDAAYRGHGVARWLLYWVLERFPGLRDGAVVAIRPVPLGEDGRTLDPGSLGEGADAEVARRTQRLIALYESAGFKRLDGSEVWALNTAYQRPDPRGSMGL
jgi:GNAT superfamily N-acetyltransferase